VPAILRSKAAVALKLAVISCRKEAGLTQEQVARGMGWDQQQMSNLETGQRGLDVTETPKLSKALQTTPLKFYRRFLSFLNT
jgi:transcriptional regulator with XRE-family HTH domain